MEQPPGWDFFDKIYCITLTSRPDRMREAERQFAAVDLDGSVEFLLAEKDHENPERGIYQSHMLCLQKGLEAGARHILIFEDDVFFRRFSHQRLHQACLCLHVAITQPDPDNVRAGHSLIGHAGGRDQHTVAETRRDVAGAPGRQSAAAHVKRGADDGAPYCIFC